MLEAFFRLHPGVAYSALPEDDGADKSPLARKSTDSKVAMLPMAATTSAPAPAASAAAPAAAATTTTAAAAAGTPSKPAVLAVPAPLVRQNWLPWGGWLPPLTQTIVPAFSQDC